ncbi:hypothetical protein RM531_00035 [Salinisphaera sp. P385]|uniref:GCVT N-terminal domain-containing protein n=1 Tax=Spectribacter acetivorans TaxID=3075603 RepID=A0ABU3B322_9GAMM|nr:hypothetical protein [Salinisphaera sp. P385]MDT0616849.1 hypothetical protein [Salinisphaera sp. P385]
MIREQMNPGADAISDAENWPDDGIRLSHIGAIEVAGDDANSFLNAQITADTNRVKAGQSRPAAWCDAQGRALAVFQVIRLEPGRFLLLCAADLVAETLKRLQMFVLRARVTLAALPDNWDRRGFPLESATRALDDVGLSGLEEDNAVAHNDGWLAIRLPGDPARCLLAARRDTEAETAGVDDPRRLAAWRLAGIRAGLPVIHTATRALFVPQMLNLHWLNGLDFDKGCYPGQEVVARLQFRGKLKRRLFRGATTAACRPGDAVIDADDGNAGTILDAAPDGNGRNEVLAVLKLSTTEQSLQVNGEAMELRELPYATDPP